MDYDFIVIGAGPAGSTFTRLLAERYSVLIVDKRHLDDSESRTRPKACGGLLNPDAQRELAILGLALPLTVMRGPQMFSVKAIDFDNSISAHYQKSYINIDRELFDRYLFSLIPERVKKLCGSFYRGHSKINGGIKVKIRRGDSDEFYTCRRLIGADGASSMVLRHLKNKEDLARSYVCHQVHYEFKHELPYMFSVFDREVSDYYSWGIKKEDTLVLGAAIADKANAKARFETLEKRLIGVGLDLSAPFHREGALLFRPRSPKDVFLGKKPIHLIGEAAGLISPSSSEGISYALKSARLLASAINKSYAGFEYDYLKLCRGMMTSVFSKSAKSLLMYDPLSRNAIIRSGALKLDTCDRTFAF